MTTNAGSVLIDCGMTALAALGRAQVRPRALDAVLISHLHGDHFGGVPLLLLEKELERHSGGPRTDLTIAGPLALAERVQGSLELFGWPDVWPALARNPSVRLMTLVPGSPIELAGLEITVYAVPHGTAGFAFRIASPKATLAYSGDAGWTSELLAVAANADLFVCNVWSYDQESPTFISYRTLREHRAELRCKRIVLTHLGPQMLARRSDIEDEVAEDGIAIDL